MGFNEVHGHGTFPTLALLTTSMFGHASVPVKAGDRAPNLRWARLAASAADSGGPSKLLGAVSVLLFLPSVSHNHEAVSSWNKLVEQFAGKPVNFVWIANESEDFLTPFLKTHVVRGWLVLDPAEDSYKAYGVKGATGVLIDTEGIVAGFTFMTPQQDEIQAVLDGHAIAIEGDATEAQLDAIFEGRAVRLESEPFRRQASPLRSPDLPLSDEVHISLSHTNGTESSTMPDHWIRRGFDLRTILAEVSGVNPSRVILPAVIDDGKRYDFVLAPPREEANEEVDRRVSEAIKKHFDISIKRIFRSTDVYVMTALEGKTPSPKSDEVFYRAAISISTEWQEPKFPEGAPATRKALQEAARKLMDNVAFGESSAAGQLTAMSAVGTSMEGLCRALESGLHRPVVDETGMTGIYDFKVKGKLRTTEAFLVAMREQLGLLLTPAQKSIEMVVVQEVKQAVLSSGFMRG